MDRNNKPLAFDRMATSCEIPKKQYIYRCLSEGIIYKYIPQNFTHVVLQQDITDSMTELMVSLFAGYMSSTCMIF